MRTYRSYSVIKYSFCDKRTGINQNGRNYHNPGTSWHLTYDRNKQPLGYTKHYDTMLQMDKQTKCKGTNKNGKPCTYKAYVANLRTTHNDRYCKHHKPK